MLNASKIRARMKELEISEKELAEALSMPFSRVMRVLNNISALNLAEALSLGDLLMISDEEFSEYFFA